MSARGPTTLILKGSCMLGLAASLVLLNRGPGGGVAAPATCASTQGRAAGGVPRWHAMRPPLSEIDFAFEWSEDFQAYELLLRNRSDADVRFTLEAWTDVPSGRVLFSRRWSLPRRVREWPPGLSVTARDGAVVCLEITEFSSDR